MGAGGPIWWVRETYFGGGGNGAYLVGKGDLFDRGGGPIWWGRGAYLVGNGGPFFGGEWGPY